MADPYPASLRALVSAAVDRSERRLAAGAPTLAAELARWTRGLAGGAEPGVYFTHHDAFPMLLLPWWAEAAATGREPDASFQLDLASSTICGYWFTRIVDDVMDGDPVPPAVLPSLLVLHAEFLAPLRAWFPAGHAFWETFDTASFDAAETAARDSVPREITPAEFELTSARKVAGGLIPVAAVCHHLGRAHLLVAWSGLINLVGRWHQLLNDVQGWAEDLDAGRPSYFLSEARRQSGPAVAEWVVGGGLAWAVGMLDAWMAELLEAARGLGSEPLVAYLEGRRDDVRRRWSAVAPGLDSLSRLARALG